MALNPTLVAVKGSELTPAEVDANFAAIAAAVGNIPESIDLTSATATTPAAGTVRMFRNDQGGRQMLAFMGPEGANAPVQPFMANRKYGFWNPSGNSSSSPGIVGFAVLTALGTATTRNFFSTNFITRLRRIGYVSAASAGSFAGHYSLVRQFTIGTGTQGLGGFHYVCRFVPSDAANVAGARMFVGMREAVAAPTNVEPDTLTDLIGVAQLSTSNNLHLVYGGSATQTAIDLGASFPANGASTAAYELQLFAPSGAQTVGWMVTRLDTGDTVSGILSGTVGTAIPLGTTGLNHAAWRCNNATALACGLDIVQVYIETDN